MSDWVDLKADKNTSENFLINIIEDGLALDISEWTIYFTVKKNMKDEDSEALIDKTITEHSSPEQGKTIIELTPQDTDLDPGNYYFSVDFKTGEDFENVLVHGRLKITDTVRDDRS